MGKYGGTPGIQMHGSKRCARRTYSLYAQQGTRIGRRGQTSEAAVIIDESWLKLIVRTGHSNRVYVCVWGRPGVCAHGWRVEGQSRGGGPPPGHCAGPSPVTRLPTAKGCHSCAQVCVGRDSVPGTAPWGGRTSSMTGPRLPIPRTLRMRGGSSLCGWFHPPVAAVGLEKGGL